MNYSFFKNLQEDTLNIRKADIAVYKANWNGDKMAGNQFLKHLVI